jgi:CRP-like cAMP-binding protein
LSPTAEHQLFLRGAFEACLAGAPWLLPKLSDSEWQKFSAALSLRRLNDGETLIQSGVKPVPGAFVVSGILRAYYLSPDGEEHNRSFAGVGNFAAPLAAGLTAAASEVTIAAVGPAVAITIDLQDFLAMYNVSAAWDRIGRIITERFYLMRERHAQQLLTLTAKERFEAFVRDFPDFHRILPKKQIASFLGIRPETLARLSRTC